jgi:hypothetical protein
MSLGHYMRHKTDTRENIFVTLLVCFRIPLLLMTVAYQQIARVLWKKQKLPGQAETIKLTPAEQSKYLNIIKNVL